MQLHQIFLISVMAITPFCYAQTEQAQHNPNVPLTNFANFNSGQEFCDNQQAADPNIKSCIPIYNTNENAYLNFTIKKIVRISTVAPKYVLPVVFYHEKDSFDIKVTNAVENKVIYSGPAYDMVGIICNYTNCKPWK
ncbi:hypothetical protein D5018_13455 [Parashewanella curva]|uniref:Uncharacterized protein n=1 Tax=Parashewanella curva TaxID=2338552 RepID=A0A3L8PV09_9GAMM|nr:hypothetical protein [Parashewanella curva]RLV59144.1 hypothetical protein D5018_13455 [Parashewanella curva]